MGTYCDLVAIFVSIFQSCCWIIGDGSVVAWNTDANQGILFLGHLARGPQVAYVEFWQHVARHIRVYNTTVVGSVQDLNYARQSRH